MGDYSSVVSSGCTDGLGLSGCAVSLVCASSGGSPAGSVGSSVVGAIF